MAKTTKWLNGSLSDVVAASVLRVADLLHVSSEVYLCQSDEWHTKSVSSNVLAF